MNTDFMCPSSVAKERRNFLRAGTLQKRSLTSTHVPGGAPHSDTSAIVPAFTTSFVAASLSLRRVMIVNLETDAMDGIASPLNPSVSMFSISSTSRILDVACRSSERRALSRFIPHPLSLTDTSLRPPAVTEMSMRSAPASMEFSTSSLSADAGRSTTSPAAILFAT